MAKIHLEIVTPERPVLKEEVDEVVIPGLFGEFGVLSGHTTFLSELGSGRLTYTRQGESKSFEIAGGFAEVRQDQVTVLADSVKE
jgi:F-type H+-transporting ATPase subunit epsilon